MGSPLALDFIPELTMQLGLNKFQSLVKLMYNFPEDPTLFNKFILKEYVVFAPL